MTQQTWHSLRIYYNDTNKDALLLDCVQPLFLTLSQRGWAERAYFRRHWQGGSHVRLHILADAEFFQREIAPYSIHEIETYIQHFPSKVRVSEQDAQLQHARRQRLTLNQIDYETLQPNNSVQVAPYDQLAAAIGSPGAAQLLEDYYVETNALVFSLIEQTRDNYTARLNTCFDQLVALVAGASFLPLNKAYMSYRSHVEAYIVCEPEVEDATCRRQRLANAYQQRKPAIQKRLALVLELIQHRPANLPGWLADMLAIHRTYGTRALQSIQAGTLRLYEADEETENDHIQKGEFRLAASEFHAAVKANSAMRDLNSDPTMLADRVILNFLYLHLSRLGMLNEDRYILDYYIAESIEELFHISPIEVVRSFAGL